jgi:hypothetical protein
MIAIDVLFFNGLLLLNNQESYQYQQHTENQFKLIYNTCAILWKNGEKMRKIGCRSTDSTTKQIRHPLSL